MLTQHAAKTIYQTMIIPILTYCSFSMLKSSSTNERKLDNLHIRSTNVIRCDKKALQSINGIKKTKACLFLRRCVENTVTDNFENYFTLLSGANTRNRIAF